MMEDIILRYGKLNGDFHEYAHNEKEESEESPRFRIPPEDVNSYIDSVTVEFDNFSHIADAVHHMLVMSKELREDEHLDGIVVRTIWNGYDIEVQWSWNREIDWGYIDETVRESCSEHSEPCGLWLYPERDWEEMNEGEKDD